MKCNNCNNPQKKIAISCHEQLYDLKKQQHFSPQMDFRFFGKSGENMQAILNEKKLASNFFLSFRVVIAAIF
jgi:hypothetical protein